MRRTALLTQILLFVLVLSGCGKECAAIVPPELQKTSHVSCEYTIEKDGYMTTLNAQKADKCAQKLWNNQSYYEHQIDTYNEWKMNDNKKSIQ